MKRAMLYGQEVQPRTCGRMAVENAARAYWQSRQTTKASGLAPLPELTNIPAMAAQVRATFQSAEDAQQ